MLYTFAAGQGCQGFYIILVAMIIGFKKETKQDGTKDRFEMKLTL